MIYTILIDPWSRVKSRYLEGRTFLTLILILSFIWSLTAVKWGESLFHPGGLLAFRDIASAALYPELSTSFLILAAKSAWSTLAYAITGMCLAIFLGLPLGVLASGVLTKTKTLRIVEVSCVRFLLGFCRATHELVWAWFFIVAFGLSPIAAIFALAIPYGGILGRIYADILNDIPNEPLRALRSAGASEFKILIYGRLPMALPNMVSYSIYRLECAIRATAIMGFVGVGGIGFQLQLSLSSLHYNEVWTLLYILVGIIIVGDTWSNWLRRSITP